MKTSRFILGAVLAVITAILLVVSCADSSSPSCDLADCTSQCQAAGHLGGECRDGACYCTEVPPADADADTPDTVDIIDTTPDPGTEDTVLPDPGTDDATTADDFLREEYVREEYVREDYTSTSEDGTSTDIGDVKSGGCDPLVCFMTCGGTCAPDGTCVCESPAP